jgi:hypothetical protein
MKILVALLSLLPLSVLASDRVPLGAIRMHMRRWVLTMMDERVVPFRFRNLINVCTSTARTTLPTLMWILSLSRWFRRPIG